MERPAERAAIIVAIGSERRAKPEFAAAGFGRRFLERVFRNSTEWTRREVFVSRRRSRLWHGRLFDQGRSLRMRFFKPALGFGVFRATRRRSSGLDETGNGER